jgi:tripartite-type tricarboxylate transporter receptor subunit TctC
MKNTNHSTIRRQLLIGAAIAGASFAAPSVWAQGEWPAGRVVSWVVPYPPGGTTDVLGRALTKHLAATIGSSVIVENKAGASGTIGGGYVVKAAPDGYTLLGTSIGPQTIAPHLLAAMPYDPLTKLAPVITVGTIPHILVVGANQPFKSVADLVAAAKANPGKLAFASGGIGTILQMQGELFGMQTGTKFTHVPYKGDTPSIADTIGEQVNFMFAPAAASLPHIRSGKLKALAVTSASRLPGLPDTPTMAQAGIKDFVVEQWQAVYAPLGTPAPIIEKVNAALNAALKQPDVVALGERLGITLVGGTPEQLDARQKSDSAKWGRVIREANIKAK